MILVLKGENGQRLKKEHVILKAILLAEVTTTHYYTSEYIIEYDDGTSDRMFANSIAENIYSQVDDEGKHFVLLNEIVDHRTTAEAVKRHEGFTTMPNGRKVPKRTTKGWELLVEWKDGSSSWVPLKDIKDTNPVKVAEYVIANKIEQEPAFSWWVSFVMQKRERIIAKLQKKYWRTEYKFGVRIPKTVDEALQIDQATGKTLGKRNQEGNGKG